MNEASSKRSYATTTTKEEDPDDVPTTTMGMNLPWDKDNQADSHSSHSNSDDDVSTGQDEGVEEVKRKVDDRNTSPVPETLRPLKKLTRSKSRLFQKPDDTFLPSNMSSSDEDYQRVHFKDRLDDKESLEASRHLLSMCDLRDKYVYRKPDVYWGSYDPKKYQELYDRSEEELEKKGRWRKEMPFYARTRVTESKSHPFRELKKSKHLYRKSAGVFRVYIPNEKDEDREKYYVKPPNMQEFYEDYLYIVKTINLGPVRSLSYRRLRLLSARFHLHQQLNLERELKQQRIVRHRDFYNIRKVDTHVHHSSSMTQKHLLRFIKSKLKKSPNDYVMKASVAIKGNGSDVVPEKAAITLSQLFESLDLTAYVSRVHRFGRLI